MSDSGEKYASKETLKILDEVQKNVLDKHARNIVSDALDMLVGQNPDNLREISELVKYIGMHIPIGEIASDALQIKKKSH